MTKIITKIETWLPIFPGFYNTIFEADYEDELYSQNQEIDDSLPKLEYDDIDFNSGEYEEEVVRQCCSFIEDNLKEFVSKIEFQHINSPREYNFRNDSGNIEVSLSNKNIKNIFNYIYENLENYKKYLKNRYTSYDGFMSWYDNDFDSWVEYTDNFTDYSKKSHYLGSVLEFICRNEGIDEYMMYESMNVYTSEYCTWRTEQIKCEECGEWYESKDSPEHKEYDKNIKRMKELWEETQGNKPYKIKSFKETYPEFSYKCSRCKE